jgi:3D-(3,5/4)-trihydroxycyclohexane-1,2-dione acylhydrolase (decyclizing)
LEQAIEASKKNDRTSVIVIDTDPLITTDEGGHWWDVAVPEVSPRAEVNQARAGYEKARAGQRIG